MVEAAQSLLGLGSTPLASGEDAGSSANPYRLKIASIGMDGGSWLRFAHAAKDAASEVGVGLEFATEVYKLAPDLGVRLKASLSLAKFRITEQKTIRLEQGHFGCDLSLTVCNPNSTSRSPLSLLEAGTVVSRGALALQSVRLGLLIGYEGTTIRPSLILARLVNDSQGPRD